MKRLIFFTYPSCTSCRKTKAWLKKNNVDFQERHIFRETPKYDELMDIIKLTNEGIQEIIATRSSTYKELDLDLNELRVSEVLSLLHKEPRLLRRPIITDGERLIVGYNRSGLEELTDIGRFVSKNVS